MHSRIINSDNEGGMMKSLGPYRFTDSDNSASLSANSETFEPVRSFTVGNPISPTQADDYMLSKEREGLSTIEKAALELSMNRHRRAYNLLASD
ncbi:MAG: hypothetical protein U9N40_06140 [Euryarchaeota archaeon]|nr:hypothetical protein [Euryarchaeota archaeon]